MSTTQRTEQRQPETVFGKIWDAHVVRSVPGESTILYIDRHLVHEVTSDLNEHNTTHGTTSAKDDVWQNLGCTRRALCSRRIYYSLYRSPSGPRGHFRS